MGNQSMKDQLAGVRQAMKLDILALDIGALDLGWGSDTAPAIVNEEITDAPATQISKEEIAATMYMENISAIEHAFIDQVRQDTLRYWDVRKLGRRACAGGTKTFEELEAHLFGELLQGIVFLRVVEKDGTVKRVQVNLPDEEVKRLAQLGRTEYALTASKVLPLPGKDASAQIVSEIADVFGDHIEDLMDEAGEKGKRLNLLARSDDGVEVGGGLRVTLKTETSEGQELLDSLGFAWGEIKKSGWWAFEDTTSLLEKRAEVMPTRIGVRDMLGSVPGTVYVFAPSKTWKSKDGSPNRRSAVAMILKSEGGRLSFYDDEAVVSSDLDYQASLRSFARKETYFRVSDIARGARFEAPGKKRLPKQEFERLLGTYILFGDALKSGRNQEDMEGLKEGTQYIGPKEWFAGKGTPENFTVLRFSGKGSWKIVDHDKENNRRWETPVEVAIKVGGNPNGSVTLADFAPNTLKGGQVYGNEVAREIRREFTEALKGLVGKEFHVGERFEGVPQPLQAMLKAGFGKSARARNGTTATAGADAEHPAGNQE